MPERVSSKRASARKAARERRSGRREWRRNLLELVAAGHAYDEIADKAGVSVSTIKRQVQRALAERPPDPVESFVALQRERLNRALQYTDLAMQRGDLRAVAALVSLLPHVDRYWGLQSALAGARAGAETAQISAPKSLESLPTELQFPQPGEPAPVARG